MTPTRKRRLALVMCIVLGVGAATALAVTAFRQNLLFFYTPSDLADAPLSADRNFRLGGLVVDGSVKRQANGITVAFAVTDQVQTQQVMYTGILPDLFREGQGIVALGRLRKDGVFMAEEVLAKHDENYMPPEVAEAMRDVHEKQVAGTVQP